MRTLTFALFILAASAVRADEAHSIDWYATHPAALKNALIQCNTSNGLIATQDCRNALQAARILASATQAPSQPSP